MPEITLPDESIRSFDHPISIDDIAHDIGPGLAQATIAGRINGNLCDASEIIDHDCKLEIITIKDDEWDETGKWMWENRDHYNGLSVLPYDGGTYTQAPFEDISKVQYDMAMTHLKDVDLSKIVETEDETDLSGELACAGGACEIT